MTVKTPINATKLELARGGPRPKLGCTGIVYYDFQMHKLLPFEILKSSSKTSGIRTERANNAQNTRQALQMRKPSFQMLASLLKCSDYLSKCSNRHQNVRNQHRKTKQCSKHTTGSRNARTIFRNAQIVIVFKNVRNPHRKSKECRKHMIEPQMFSRALNTIV